MQSSHNKNSEYQITRISHNNMNKCCHLTSRGQPCGLNAYHIYENKPYCGMHLNYIKAHEECCICFCDMNKRKDRIKLSCGHYFHKSCLGKCDKQQCPLCRSSYIPDDSYEIFKDTYIKAFFMDVFSFTSSIQSSLIDGFNTLLNIACISEIDRCDSRLSLVNGFLTLYEKVDISSRDINNLFSTIHTAFEYLAEHKSLNGFCVQFCEDTVHTTR